MESPLVVSVTNVTKRYAAHTAVQDLSLDIPRGAVYGLLGPNGAGKTTTIRMIMNIIVPDQGRVSLFGEPSEGRRHSHRIGYLPEERGLYRRMKVRDLLVFLAEIKGLGRRRAREDSVVWLDRLGLGDWTRKKVDDLSKGMQQKVQFISTVLHRPDLLILDEPFAGLDPVNAQIMKDVVLELARAGTTVLFSTHIMEQAEKLCDSVCIIARGRTVVNGTLKDVKRGHGGRHVVIGVEGGIGSVARVLSDTRLVAHTDGYGTYAEVELVSGADPQRLLKELVAAGARLNRFEIAQPTLNKVFMDLVGRDAGTAPSREEPGGRG